MLSLWVKVSDLLPQNSLGFADYNGTPIRHLERVIDRAARALGHSLPTATTFRKHVEISNKRFEGPQREAVSRALSHSISTAAQYYQAPTEGDTISTYQVIQSIIDGQGGGPSDEDATRRRSPERRSPTPPRGGKGKRRASPTETAAASRPRGRGKTPGSSESSESPTPHPSKAKRARDRTPPRGGKGKRRASPTETAAASRPRGRGKTPGSSESSESPTPHPSKAKRARDRSPTPHRDTRKGRRRVESDSPSPPLPSNRERAGDLSHTPPRGATGRQRASHAMTQMVRLEASANPPPQQPMKTKRARSSSPKTPRGASGKTGTGSSALTQSAGSGKRKKFTKEETTDIETFFKRQVETNELPSLTECREFLEIYKLNRTPKNIQDKCRTIEKNLSLLVVQLRRISSHFVFQFLSINVEQSKDIELYLLFNFDASHHILFFSFSIIFKSTTLAAFPSLQECLIGRSFLSR